MRGNAVINRRRGGIRFPKLRAAVMIIAAAAFLWFLLPIVVGVLNVGNAMGLCVCAVVFLTACFGGRLTERGGIFRMIYYAIVLLLGLGVIWAGILSGLMVWGLSNTVRADEENIPVIVLGCQVKGGLAEHGIAAADQYGGGISAHASGYSMYRQRRTGSRREPFRSRCDCRGPAKAGHLRGSDPVGGYLRQYA